MFADPPQAGLLRPEFFHHRARIHVMARGTIRLKRLERPFEGLELFLEHAMIILAPGIPGNPPVAASFIRMNVSPVIEAEGKNRTAVRQHLRRIGTPFGRFVPSTPSCRDSLGPTNAVSDRKGCDRNDWSEKNPDPGATQERGQCPPHEIPAQARPV